VNFEQDHTGAPDMTDPSDADFPPRPSFIGHYSQFQAADDARYPGSEELLAIGAPIGRKLGLTRIGVHHKLLPPGRRTSFPHAELAEEEFVYVLEGNPSAWIDGVLHPLGPGDAVAFPAGTGIAHSFVNETEMPAALLVIGEATKPENRVAYPVNPEMLSRKDYWTDWPARPLGPHDGRPRNPNAPAQVIDRIDHIVLTVADIDATCRFYRDLLAMTVIEFSGGRKALAFGRQKINLHQAGREFEPKALRPTPGSGDFCLITTLPLERIADRLAAVGVAIELGPVARTGATGSMRSLYFRDPDRNLVEVSAYEP
jgi:uncharacterized cupin superfamily protein/catechol 2,3-dioxygenase-like lactoylglutathione lyase family enzyme